MRKYLALLLVLISAPVTGTGPWQLGLASWEKGGFHHNVDGEDNAVERAQLTLAYRWDDGNIPGSGPALRYVHQRLLIRKDEPASNGYLHQIDWRQTLEWERSTLEFTLGVHGTSNMFKHGDFHSDSLVASGAAWRDIPDWDQAVGVAGDYRFGSFLLYPRWRFELETGTSSLRADLPVALSWGPGDRRWELALERYGDKWGTLDGGREVQDKLYLSEWRFGGTYRFPTGWRRVSFEVGAGISFDTRVSYRDLVDGWRRERLDNRLYGSLALRW